MNSPSSKNSNSTISSLSKWWLLAFGLTIACLFSVIGALLLSAEIHDQAHQMLRRVVELVSSPSTADEVFGNSLITRTDRMETQSQFRRQVVTRVTDGLSIRTKRAATRNIVQIPAEIVPVIGIPIIIGVTLADINDYCINLDDVNQLRVAYGLPPEDKNDVCSKIDSIRESYCKKIKCEIIN